MAIKRSFILPSGLGISANDLYIVGSTASTNSTSERFLKIGSQISCFKSSKDSL